MITKNIYDYMSYKSYLKAQEAIRPHGGRGFRAELANITGCQTTYVTKVLNTDVHFSLEQAFRINNWLVHDEDEARHFVHLVEYNRAGTRELQNHFKKLIEESLQRHLNLKKRIEPKDELNSEDKMRYYSEWYYIAIHILSSVPEFNNIEAIAAHMNLNKILVTKVVKFLSGCGMVSIDNHGRITAGNIWVHLGKDSPFITKHHTNWRIKTIQSFEKESENELHYTSVISLSYDDILKLKTHFVKSIDVYNEIVKPSKEETMYCLCLDFFKV